MVRSALFSEGRTKRLQLIRDWGAELLSATKTVNFVMLNPSDADEAKDDPTVRKCIGFAKRWGFGRLVVTNLIATIATDPWKLPTWSGIDMLNRAVIQEWMGKADLIVAAWGSQPAGVCRTIALSEHILLLRQTAPVPLHCIGTTARGEPLHPSRAAYTNAPVLWAKEI